MNKRPQHGFFYHDYEQQTVPDIRVGDVVRKQGGQVPYVVAHVERHLLGHCTAKLIDQRTGKRSRAGFCDNLIVLHRDPDAPTEAPPIPWAESALQRFADVALNEAARDWYADHATADDLHRLGWRVACLTDAGEDLIVIERNKIVIADPGLSLDAVARRVLPDIDAFGCYVGTDIRN